MRWILLALTGLFFTTGAAMAEMIETNNDQLKQLLQDNVPLVDIRTAPEWTETGVVKDSHLLTFFHANGSYDSKAFMTAFEKIAGKDDPVVLICRTGRRTGLISQFLVQKVGYTKVYNVTKGIHGWIEAGQPTVSPQ